MNITRWRPDTCDCDIHYSWDPDIPVDKREHTTYMVLPCALHAKIHETFGQEQAHVVVLFENQLKNRAIGVIKESRSDILDSDIIWSFDSNRNLTIAIDKLDSQSKSDLQQAVDLSLGAGVVISDIVPV